MLRRQLGDSVFKKSIRQYYATYAGKNAETKDLQKIFESVSGKNLEQFFKQWLYCNENPKLEIIWKYLDKEQKLSITIKQTQKNVFNFPLQIAIGISSGNSKPQIKDFKITKPLETFIIPVGRKAFLFSNGIDP
jgi:aminopeptidase N